MSNGGNRDWVEAIAAKAKVDVSAVTRILGDKGIRPSPVVATPRRLAVRKIEFAGLKTETAVVPGPFEFAWDDLGPGLWAMVTEKNLRGKSSVIEVVKWMLRGRASDLQEDVRKWLHRCRLTFTLDDIVHEVRLETPVAVSGRLIRVISGAETELASFVGDPEFEAVMSDFFLKEFGLDVITRWKKAGAEELGGKAVSHGWPSLSGAMFIGTNYSVLLGDIPADSGMTVPLMQMYLGLPWVSTLTAAKAAEQSVKTEREVRERRRKAGDAERSRRLEEIRAELERKKIQRDATPSDVQIRTEMARLQTELGVQSTAEVQAVQQLNRAQAAASDAKAAYLADSAELQAQIDAEAAGAIFRNLDPSCCPRCDAAITDDRRKREKATHSCSVCGEVVESQGDAQTVLADLEARTKASKSARDKTRKSLTEAETALEGIRSRITELNKAINSLAEKLSEFDVRHKLDIEVAALEARLQEAAFDPEPEIDDGPEAAVLKATVNETEKRVKTVQEGLLKAVSEEIVVYARRFGMGNLTAATLKGNTHLSLVKGGSETGYGKCTLGEMLRLKVATVLAMIKAAEKEGVGRHPGLLMIDSPGAQEIAREDLDQLVSGLQEVSTEFGHLQVFIATITSPAVMDYVPNERMRYAKGDAPLW